MKPRTGTTVVILIAFRDLATRKGSEAPWQTSLENEHSEAPRTNKGDDAKPTGLSTEASEEHSADKRCLIPPNRCQSALQITSPFMQGFLWV